MVRAGEGGYVADEFAKGFVAIGFNGIGDLSSAPTPKAIKAALPESFSGPQARQDAAPIPPVSAVTQP
jgi:hypothetical protein